MPHEQIYSASRQLTKLRLVYPLCLLCGAALLWLGWSVLHTYGIHPSEGGVLAPFHLRLLLGGFLAALGAFIILGIVGFMQFCYVSRIDVVDGDRLQLVLAGIMAPSTVEVSEQDLRPATYHSGNYEGEGSATPYLTVRLQSRRLPLIVDLQGEVVDAESFARLFDPLHKRRSR
ncbi:MAG TPA: hypothetical protein VF701_20255 [Thermoanaerobaculia bacterium]